MSARIEDLEPMTRHLCEDFLQQCGILGLAVRVTHTLRTMEEQAHLYAKGRSLPGEPCEHGGVLRPVGTCKQHPLGRWVTRAKPGQSAHNFGAAFDICFVGKVAYPKVDDPLWARVGEAGEGAGLSWGGPRGKGDRFTFDRPHFERPDWRTLRGTA